MTALVPACSRRRRRRPRPTGSSPRCWKTSGTARTSGVVVDSPPGAGKSTLVVRAALTLADDGEQVMVVAQTNEQVDDLVHRLAVEAPSAVRSAGCQRRTTCRRRGWPSTRRSWSRRRLATSARLAVIVGTAAKWTFVNDGLWPWAIVDEAYQMRSDMLLRIAHRFERALFVGDPGQLDPFSTVETERWRGLTWDPMQSAVAVLLRHNPDLRQHRLPVSWRLPATAAPVVSEAFYPFAPFVSGTAAGRAAALVPDRGDRWGSGRPGAVDGGGDGMGAVRTAGAACVADGRRGGGGVRGRGAAAAGAWSGGLLARSSPEGEPVTPDRIAIGTAHRDQAAAMRAAWLGAAGRPGSLWTRRTGCRAGSTT